MRSALITFIFILSAQVIYSQKVISSAIGAGGATTVVDGKYYSQIIGQQSVVTGTSTNGGVVVRQGFKQPSLLEHSRFRNKVKCARRESHYLYHISQSFYR